MDKRILIVAGILVVAVGVVLIARSSKKPPPSPATQAPPFPELQAERPAGDANWVHPAIQKIDRMEVTKAGTTLEIHRTEAGDGRRSFGEWEIVKPFKYKADEYSVRQVIQRATSLKFWEVASTSKDDHAAMGVDDAQGLRIALYEKDRKIADFMIGKEVSTEVNERPLTYAFFREAGKDQVWKLNGSLKILTDKDISSWRDPKILHLKREEITEIRIVSPQGTIAVAQDPNAKDPKKPGAVWSLASSEPAIPALEQTDVARIASTLSYLRTQDFVDDPKAEETGLGEPAYQITVTTKDKASHTLLLGKSTEKTVKRGKQEVKEKHIYVQVKDKPQVFLVQENRLTALMKSPQDLRDRSVVRLSPEQKVTRFEVFHKGDHVAFAHDGKDWKVEKPEGLAFDPTALTRDLEMLSGRFTAKELAKETDPTKTGLGKPQGRVLLTVETHHPAPAKETPADPKADPMAEPSKTPEAPDTKPKAPVKTRPAKVEVVEIFVGNEGAPRELFVQVKGRPEVFVVPQHTLNRLWKDKGGWNPPKRPAPTGMPGMPGMPSMPGRPPGR